MIRSSLILDRLDIQIEAFDRNSIIVSLEAVASKEFLMISENPSSFATNSLSIGKSTPANAPLPRGSWFILFRLSLNRSSSLLNISRYAKK